MAVINFVIFHNITSTKAPRKLVEKFTMCGALIKVSSNSEILMSKRCD